MGSDDFYEEDQITSDLIEKIKDAIVRNEEDGPYNIYAAYDDGDWLCMYFREDLVFIQITCEPDHEYVYYDKKYEGKYDLKLIEFDQSEVPRIETCEDMVLAANIFEEWALYGKRYPATHAPEPCHLTLGELMDGCGELFAHLSVCQLSCQI